MTMDDYTADFYLGTMAGEPALVIPGRIHSVLFLTNVWEELSRCMGVFVPFFESFDYGEGVVISGHAQLAHLVNCVNSVVDDLLDPNRIYNGVETFPPTEPGGSPRSVVTASATGRELTSFLTQVADLARTAIGRGEDLVAVL